MMLRSDTIDVEAMNGPSPMADGKTNLMSSQRHHTRYPMETRCGSKSNKKTVKGDEDDQ